MTTWPRRCGWTTEHLLALTLALLCALGGWLLMVFHQQVAPWLVLTLASIWVGLKGAPWLVRRMEHLGLFGRVRLDGSRLTVAGSGKSTDLERPFHVTTRLHEKDLSYEFDMRFVRGGIRKLRTERRSVTLLQARLEQDGAHVELVADEVAVPPPPSHDVTGLSCRRAPVDRPSGPVVRMRTPDLLALLRALTQCAGYRATTPEDTQELVRDPRALFGPPWKRWAGGTVLFALALGLGVWAMEARVGSSPLVYVPPTPEQAAERARAAAQSEGAHWVDKSVGFLQTKPNYVYGVVRSFDATPPPEGASGKWSITLEVEIRRILDESMDPMPAGSRVSLPGTGQDVEVGSVVQVATDRVYASEGP